MGVIRGMCCSIADRHSQAKVGILRAVMSASNSKYGELGDRIKNGSISEADLKLLDAFRRDFRESYEWVRVKCGQAGLGEVTGRPSKSTGSIIRKLRRESTRLPQIQDIAGLRIVVADVVRQERVAKTLEVFLGSVKVHDRRAKPSNGYRAVHLVSVSTRRPVEIQIRTVLQHQWAEMSEKLSDTVDAEIKYGAGPKPIVVFLRKLSVGIQTFEEAVIRHNKIKGTIGQVRGRAPGKIRKQLRDADQLIHAGDLHLRAYLDGINIESLVKGLRG